MILAELFKKVADWKWSKNTDGLKKANFTIADNKYSMGIWSFDNGSTWDVEFSLESDVKSYRASYGLNGLGNSALVMSTVVDILRDFYQDHKDQITRFTFSAEEESRKTLYTRMFKRFLPDWQMSQDPNNSVDAYMVTKPK